MSRVLAGFIAGAALAAAIPVLAEALRMDSDELVRRMASHALALIGTEAAEGALRTAVTGDADWGVRVNAAYGLGKMKREDGVRELERSYLSSETPTEYRLAILGGLADVAAPSSVPIFQRILQDTKDAGYLLLAVMGLEKVRDPASRPDLERLAANEAMSKSIREAARKALEGFDR